MFSNLLNIFLKYSKKTCQKVLCVGLDEIDMTRASVRIKLALTGFLEGQFPEVDMPRLVVMNTMKNSSGFLQAPVGQYPSSR